MDNRGLSHRQRTLATVCKVCTLFAVSFQTRFRNEIIYINIYVCNVCSRGFLSHLRPELSRTVNLQICKHGYRVGVFVQLFKLLCKNHCLQKLFAVCSVKVDQRCQCGEAAIGLQGACVSTLVGKLKAAGVPQYDLKPMAATPKCATILPQPAVVKGHRPQRPLGKPNYALRARRTARHRQRRLDHTIVEARELGTIDIGRG